MSDLPSIHVGARHVGVKYRITMVQSLDTRSELLTLKIRLFANFILDRPEEERQYAMHKSDKAAGLDVASVRRAGLFVPQFQFVNCVSKEPVAWEGLRIRPQSGTPRDTKNIIEYEVLLTGSFAQELNMRAFPFDRQVAKIAVGLLGMKITDVVLVPFAEVEGSEVAEVDADSFRGSRFCGVWHIVSDRIDIWSVEKHQHMEGTAMDLYAKFTVDLFCERIPTIYLWNVVFVMFLLLLVSGVCLSFPQQQIADRTNCVATFILTTVAYKFVLQDMLPNKPYLTWIDKYIFTSLFLQSALILFLWVEQEIVLQIPDAEEAADRALSMDKAVKHCLYGTWTIVHMLALAVFRICPDCFYTSWSESEPARDTKDTRGASSTEVKSEARPLLANGAQSRSRIISLGELGSCQDCSGAM